MKQIEVTLPAAQDIDNLLQISRQNFGSDISARYEDLIAAGLEALATNPERYGVRSSVDTAPGVLWLHLRSVRNLQPVSRRIVKPRHILVFKVEGVRIIIIRVLHDAMDLSAHLP